MDLNRSETLRITWNLESWMLMLYGSAGNECIDWMWYSFTTLYYYNRWKFHPQKCKILDKCMHISCICTILCDHMWGAFLDKLVHACTYLVTYKVCMCIFSLRCAHLCDQMWGKIPQYVQSFGVKDFFNSGT